MELVLMLLLMLLPSPWIRASRRGNCSYQYTTLSSRGDRGVSLTHKHTHAPSQPDTSRLNFRRTNSIVADMLCGLQTDCSAGAWRGEVDDEAVAEIPAQGGKARNNWALLQTAWGGTGAVYYWSSICSSSFLSQCAEEEVTWPRPQWRTRNIGLGKYKEI